MDYVIFRTQENGNREFLVSVKPVLFRRVAKNEVKNYGMNYNLACKVCNELEKNGEFVSIREAAHYR